VGRGDPARRSWSTPPNGRYEINRYCPHAGEDLAIGSIVVDGVIRCLGHNLEFDPRHRHLSQCPL